MRAGCRDPEDSWFINPVLCRLSAAKWTARAVKGTDVHTPIRGANSTSPLYSCQKPKSSVACVGCPKLTEVPSCRNKCPCGSFECYRFLCVLQFQQFDLHFRGGKNAGLSQCIWVYICVSKNNHEILAFWRVLGLKESGNKCHYCLRSFLPQPWFNPRDHGSEAWTWGVTSWQRMLKIIVNLLIYDPQQSCQTGLLNIELSR